MKYIKQILTFFANLYQSYKIYKLTKKVTKAATNQRKKRIALRYEIAKYIKKFAKLDKDNRSLYIPLDFKTKQLIKFNVEKEFGEEMTKFNVKLNNKLQVV
jgi:hypothetical protein